MAATAAAALIPVSEYLSTSYRPDCDYIDGHVEARNVGERPHGLLQFILGMLFLQNREAWDAIAIAEQRVQVNARRYRVPDVCVVRASDPPDDIVSVPPLICIEILSSQDRLGRVQRRVDDFAGMGVENIWVLDPWTRLGYVATPRGFQQPEDGVLRVAGTAIQVVLADVFAQLDKLGVAPRAEDESDVDQH